MRSLYDFLKYAFLLSVLLFFACQTTPPPNGMGDARCDNVTEKGFINVLDVNILFSEVQNRDARLEDIADFAAGNDVDVILLQEVVNGVLVGTENSAQDLREILRDKHNLDYNISTAFELGTPGLLSSANAILSRCEISFTMVKELPFTVEIEFGGTVIVVSRNVQVTRLEIPERGMINVFNTHLCARCKIKEREEQLDVLLQ